MHVMNEHLGLGLDQGGVNDAGEDSRVFLNWCLNFRVSGGSTNRAK